MGATLQIEVDYDDLTAQELLEDLNLAASHWLHLASCLMATRWSKPPVSF